MTALTAPRPVVFGDQDDTVTTVPALIALGWTYSKIGAQLRAGRWRRVGRAIVLHNGPVHGIERARIVQFNCGPRAALTAFTATASHGLQGWDREAAHVLVPAGARLRLPEGIATRVHWTSDWTAATRDARNGIVTVERAVISAAAVLPSIRAACGIAAASVQQRLTTAKRLDACLEVMPRVTHRKPLRTALADIGQGSQALSEIDFIQLCRRHGLPEPVRQAVRIERSGRRRYLDVEWTRPDGRRVVVEIDGALHLIVTRWWDDQLRQNEVVISGRTMLRFPSVIVRYEELIVVDQLRRVLGV